jgi:hypothetical protein
MRAACYKMTTVLIIVNSTSINLFKKTKQTGMRAACYINKQKKP